MKAPSVLLLVGILATPAATSMTTGRSSAPNPSIRIEDVKRFYEVYRKAQGRPDAAKLQSDYLDRGSPGLRRLTVIRNFTASRIATAIAQKPEMYVEAERCMAILPAGKRRVARSLERLDRLYPKARFPAVTIVIGPGKPIGVADETGVMIDLESLCSVTWLEPNLEDRFVHAVMHEYAHVQQAFAAPAFYGNPNQSVLEASLIEGAAEFIDKLSSGSVSDTNLPPLMKGREKEVETKFVADKDKTDLSDWVYNGSLTKPGDYGYWVGYRIVASYYAHARNKRLAIGEILEMNDAKGFLARSGWYPGIQLDP